MPNPLNEFEIRKLNRKHATSSMAIALWKATDSGFEEGSPWTVNQFQQSLAAMNSVILTASISEEDVEKESADEKIIGLLVAAETSFEMDIYMVVVAKAYQQKQVAKHLFEYLMADCKEKGIEEIFLEVRKSNTPAIRLYESQHFKKVGVRKSYYSSPIEDGIVMKYDVLGVIDK